MFNLHTPLSAVVIIFFDLVILELGRGQGGQVGGQLVLVHRLVVVGDSSKTLSDRLCALGVTEAFQALTNTPSHSLTVNHTE